MNGQLNNTTVTFLYNLPAASYEDVGYIVPIRYATATVHMTWTSPQLTSTHGHQVPQSSIIAGAVHTEPKPLSHSARSSLVQDLGNPMSNGGQSKYLPIKAPSNSVPPPRTVNVGLAAKSKDTYSRSTSSARASTLPTGIAESQGITVMLSEHEHKLWRMFMLEGTEMTVNKRGKQIFPHIVITLRGLDRDTEYTISLRVTQADPYRYQYTNHEWKKNGISDARQYPRRQIICHPHSPNTGEFWMKKPISFKQAKITNRETNFDPNILLVNSLHKYRVEIVVQVAGREPITIPIPGTEFITSTTYMNPRITQLKVDHNDYAKGFREQYRQNAAEDIHSPAIAPSILPLSPVLGSPSCYWSPLGYQIPVARPIHSAPVSGGNVLHSYSASYPYYSPINHNWAADNQPQPPGA